MNEKHPALLLAIALLLLAFASHDAGAAARQVSGKFVLQSISSRPEAVSGGSVLVRLTVPAGATWTARVNNRDLTSLFRKVGSADSVAYLALLDRLESGVNLLEVRGSGIPTATLKIVNHPLSGPIFSGPQEQPFICQTEANGLGPASNADCFAPTVVQYYYKSTDPVRENVVDTWSKSLDIFQAKTVPGLPPGFKPYDPERSAPTDVASTVTSEGRTVPYIVRRELGVINRAVYEIRFLHQPDRPLPTPWTRQESAWNGRLVYAYRGGCGSGHTQGTLVEPSSHEAVLALGYAVATSTLNVFLHVCNDVISAETTSMVKEHFTKTYGLPVHTIGWGESGGSMQLYLTAQNHPGLLDGILPYQSFPDVITYVPSMVDGALLARFFKASRQSWTDPQKAAIAGLATWRGISRWSQDRLSYVKPRACSDLVPEALIYERSANPRGVRCDWYTGEVNILGRDPSTGRARRPLDNVGIQYGLVAFNSGRITAEQFIELNEKMGGFDTDGNWTSSRIAASADDIRSAYQHGLVLSGAGGLPATAVIDWRWYSDDLGEGHDSVHTFSTHARLSAATGSAGNHVIWIFPREKNVEETIINLMAAPDPQTSLMFRREHDLVEQMDRWLDAVSTDSKAGTLAQKVARNRPGDLTDACWTTDGERVAGPSVFGPSGECTRMYPRYADPRIAAGSPVRDDVLKCELKPVSAADYSNTLSEDQLQRLNTIFRGGVCDYSRPGVGQR